MVDLEKTYMRSLVSRLTGTEQDEVRGMWSWMCWISVISARSLSFRQLDLNTWLRFSEACDIERLSSVQLLSPVRLFATPWIAACQASLSITNSQNLLKLMSIESMMPSNHLILCCPLYLLHSSFPASESFPVSRLFASGGHRIRDSVPASVLPMNIQGWFPLGWTGWISLQSKGLSIVFSNTTVQKHQFFGSQLSLESNSHIHTWPLEKP